jgi:hypothetical protein
MAVKRLLLEETMLDPSDAFLSREATGRGGRRDLSKSHDKYLCG